MFSSPQKCVFKELYFGKMAKKGLSMRVSVVISSNNITITIKNEKYLLHLYMKVTLPHRLPSNAYLFSVRTYSLYTTMHTKAISSPLGHNDVRSRREIIRQMSRGYEE